MNPKADVSRYVHAHKQAYQNALEEIRGGRKVSHWMWFIFPQMRGLGRSSTSQFYAIRDICEAAAFLKDPYLGKNLLEICQALLALETNDAAAVFGRTDARKLMSSMTLFSLVPDTDPVFQNVLDKYYNGRPDNRTLKILGLL